MKKINIHSHTLYSDGSDSVSVMMMESKKADHSAFVCTDHIYPFNLDNRCCQFKDYKDFIRQKHELMSASDYLKFPFIQGIELNIAKEEVLVFGTEVIKKVLLAVFNPDWNGNPYDLLCYLESMRDQCGIVLCHPSLSNMNSNKQYYNKLLKVIHGVEVMNRGCDYFERNLKENNIDISQYSLWKNADAHSFEEITKFQINEFNDSITTEDQLIKLIKG